MVHCTCSEQYFWCYIVGRPDQRMCQTALVLPRLSSLQRLQSVWAAAVGWVFPFLTEVHAVLSHMVTWKETTRFNSHYLSSLYWPAVVFYKHLNEKTGLHWDHSYVFLFDDWYGILMISKMSTAHDLFGNVPETWIFESYFLSVVKYQIIFIPTV